MSKSYPDSVPVAYASKYLSDAYKSGWNHGHGIACHNVPTLGEKLFSDSLGRVTVDADNIREVHADNCHAASDNSRSYSPFEFTAKEFNDHGDGGLFVIEYGEAPIGPFYSAEEARAEHGEDAEVEELPSAEELWEAFKAGTADAISADLAEYDDADYGIEEDDA